MTDQLTLMIPKVDEKATRARVKRAFKAYHENKATLETLQQVSPMYFVRGLHNMKESSGTMLYPEHDADMIKGSRVPNAMEDMNKLTERMERHQQQVDDLRRVCEAIELAVDALPAVERQIIRLTLFLKPELRQNDSLIWPECKLGKSEYYKHKEKAMLRIAFALQIEVYEKEEDVAA